MRSAARPPGSSGLLAARYRPMVRRTPYSLAARPCESGYPAIRRVAGTFRGVEDYPAEDGKMPARTAELTRSVTAPLRMHMAVTDNRASWWALAACQSADPELFFPVSEHGRGAEQETGKNSSGSADWQAASAHQLARLSVTAMCILSGAVTDRVSSAVLAGIFPSSAG